MVSPVILSEPLKEHFLKFWVGKRPLALRASRPPFVPWSCRPLPFPFITSLTAFLARLFSRSSSAIVIFCVPRTATAFRFLDPITAPSPHLPAARCKSLITHANLTKFSPPGPIAATRMRSSRCSLRMVSWTSPVILRHKWLAPHISAVLS